MLGKQREEGVAVGMGHGVGPEVGLDAAGGGVKRVPPGARTSLKSCALNRTLQPRDVPA